jgi:hypothetical protein
MNDYYLNIVAFDVPYPPDYGGAIDVFYKLKSLKANGCKIILHCFDYKYRQNDILENFCEKVYYYKRKQHWTKQLSMKPYSVLSRKNNQLLRNLTENNYPILFEGLISCYYLNRKELKNRIKIVRMCNIEHKYYFNLFKWSKNIANKIFFLLESFKLFHFQKILKNSDAIFSISESEKTYLKKRFPKNYVDNLNAFHAFDVINSKPGFGKYILYHGNLAVSENYKAAEYLCENIFPHLTYPCIIAGKNPPLFLKKLIKKFKNVRLIENPNQDEMDELISNAHINILITFQSTGIKLKLLNSVFEGRFILANSLMLEGSELNELCIEANSKNDLINECKRLIDSPFTEALINIREIVIKKKYDNNQNAIKLLASFKNQEKMSVN